MSRCRNCEAELEWDERFMSKSGKMIPLENGEPHRCPAKPNMCRFWGNHREQKCKRFANPKDPYSYCDIHGYTMRARL